MQMSAVEARNGRVDVEVPADEDAKQCARLLKDPHANVKSIDLRRGLVTSAGAGAIAKALKGMLAFVDTVEENTTHMFGELIRGGSGDVGVHVCPCFGGSVRKVPIVDSGALQEAQVYVYCSSCVSLGSRAERQQQ